MYCFWILFFLKYFVEMLMTVSARSFGLEEENIATS